MSENPYINKVEYGGETLIDLTSDSVTPQTLLEGATAHDKSGAPISGAIAVAPPSTTTPVMDGTAAVGTETTYARGDHVHPTDTSRAAADNVVTLDGAQTVTGAKTFRDSITLSTNNTSVSASLDDYSEVLTLQSSCTIKVAVASTGRQIIDMGGLKVANVRTPVTANDAANKAYVDSRSPDSQTQGNWRYKVYADGTFEAWYKATGQSITITAQSGNLYRSDAQTITLPTNMTSGKTCNIQHVSVNAAHNNYPAWGMLASIQTPTANTFRYYAMSGGSRTASPNYLVTAYVFGTLE